jgi:hypothetical protein
MTFSHYPPVSLDMHDQSVWMSFVRAKHKLGKLQAA